MRIRRRSTPGRGTRNQEPGTRGGTRGGGRRRGGAAFGPLRAASRFLVPGSWSLLDARSRSRRGLQAVENGRVAGHVERGGLRRGDVDDGGRAAGAAELGVVRGEH